MPYTSRSELPEAVKDALRDVPHAQDIYTEAFNSAFDQYKEASSREDGRSREETAHAVAWSAVKHQYEKGDDDKWHPKPE
jgi:cation transport regulator